MDITETKFDLILFWGVFYMMENYKDAITQCYRLLQDDGIIIIGDDPVRRRDRSEKGHHDDVNYDLGILMEETNLKQIDEFVSDYRITVIKRK